MSARCGGSWSPRRAISRRTANPIRRKPSPRIRRSGSAPRWRRRDWLFVREGEEIHIATTPRLTTNSSDAAVHFAAQDGGLTRLLAYQAADAIKAGRLKIVLAKFEQPALPIHIVYPTSRLLSAKVRTFIDLVTQISDWHFGGP